MTHSNVYIKGLPLECDEQTLGSLFQPHGTISSLRLFRQPNKPPFAFVKFAEVHEAQQAIAALNGASFWGSIMEVRFADSDVGAHPERTPPPSDNIFCRGFAPDCTDEDIQSLLSPYGMVVSTKILHRGDQSGQGAAALVRMASVDAASRAVIALHGQQVIGCVTPLVVRFADSFDIKVRKQAKQASQQGLQQASYLPLVSGQQALGTSTSLPAYYAMDPSLGSHPGLLQGGQALLGTSHALSVPTMSLGMSGLLPTGLGTDQAQMLMAANPSAGPSALPLDALTVSGSGPSLPGSSRQGTPVLGQGQQQQQLMLAPHLQAASGLASPSPASLVNVAYGPTGTTSLYVRNMPDDADKLFLYEKFAPFGAIHSVKVLHDDIGKSRGCGFVNFADPISAARAVSALNGLPVAGDRTLHIQFQMVRK